MFIFTRPFSLKYILKGIIEKPSFFTELSNLLSSFFEISSFFSLIEKTKRPINRGGIHFYNYYTLPSPHGYVAPVLIDILCPKNKMPTLNNRHLEPAITVSLGPNDIYARFAKNLCTKAMPARRCIASARRPATGRSGNERRRSLLSKR